LQELPEELIELLMFLGSSTGRIGENDFIKYSDFFFRLITAHHRQLTIRHWRIKNRNFFKSNTNHQSHQKCQHHQYIAIGRQQKNRSTVYS
jgi:hypothetical protein